MLKFLWIILILAILYLLALRGRSGHPGVEKLRGWNYTHRGLHSPGVPENSLAAFRAAVDHGYGSEFDVHLLRDGGLAVIHDSKLLRTTGREGRVEDLTTEELKDYCLEGTTETIPTFREVLDTFSGKAPVIIELKPSRACGAWSPSIPGWSTGSAKTVRRSSVASLRKITCASPTAPCPSR